MARKTIRRRRPKYQTVKAWLCRGRLGDVWVWLGDRNEIQYNGTWWERIDYGVIFNWLKIKKIQWLECQFTELFDISIDDLPMLGECDQVTIEIEKED